MEKRKTKSFEKWCIENNKQDILDRWDYELNDYTPSEISYSSHKKCWFKCNKHKEHKSELKDINGFTSRGEGYIKCKQCNSIAQYILDNFPDKKIEQIWDYEKNGDLNPWKLEKGSHKKIWIKCQEKDYHESYEMSCANFSSEHRCPYCQGRKVHKKDSLGQYVTDKHGEDFLWCIWSDKNEMSPFEVSIYSHKKVWWNCPDNKHEKYLRSCDNSVKCEFRCSDCVEKRGESFIEESSRTYLEELGYKVLTEYSCSIIPKNPKTRQLLPFDNEIILENGKHLIIEVHGGQHYYKTGNNSKYLKEGQTPEEYLYQRKLYDRYKRIKCIQAGYEYLEIPYTAFNKDDTYKKLINNKIKEILES